MSRSTRLWGALVTAAFSSFAWAVPATPGPAKKFLPFQATEKTLPNGLKVIVVPTGFPNLVSVQIPVQTGSRNEVEPGKSGFAHFFEHMMFRGTKNYSPEAFDAVMAKAGARHNAFTTDDFTNYHSTFAAADLEEVLKAEGDRFQNLSYEVEAFKTESRAVLGEYNKSAANPYLKLFEVMHDHAFTTHPYKHTTLGFLKDIEDMPNQFEYSKQFFDRWYRPENTAVVIAGDVQPDKAIALVTKYFGSWKRGSFKASIPQEPFAKAPVYAHVPWATQTLPLVAVGFHGPAFSETGKDFAAVDLNFDLLFGETSDLYRRLVEQEQIVDQLQPSVNLTVDPSLVTVIARVKKASDVVKVRDAILETFARAKREAVTSQRLADGRSATRNGLLRSLDNTQAIAASVASYARFRRSFDTLNNFYGVYESLTPADLLAASQKYFVDNELVVTTLSQEKLADDVATLPSLASFAPAATTAAGSELTVIDQRSPLPLLNVALSFNVGSAGDPVGKEGLAALTASMVAGAGSKAMPIDEINRAFFPLAASFTAAADKEVTTFSGTVSADGWQRFADVALPMLLEPGFRPEDFQRLKEQQLNQLVSDLRSNNEEELGRERLSAWVYSGTRYGYPSLGTVAGLKAVTLDDVKAFAAKHYTRANLVVGLAGATTDELVAKLRARLAQLPAGAAEAATAKPVGRKAKGLEVELVKKDTRSTAISFGFPTEVTRSHPDFAALNVARAWLGEHRSSMARLYQRIREVRGMNYGDYAYIEAFPRAGSGFFLPRACRAERSCSKCGCARSPPKTRTSPCALRSPSSTGSFKTASRKNSSRARATT